jgi:hypothetical protein
VREYRCQHKGRRYVLVDTPGFDDSYRSNDEIVDAILTWLEQTYRAKVLLSGIIYLHRISDVRMQGGALDNLRMFRKLCGTVALQNVLLVTTFWDRVEDSEGRLREEELASNDEFWARMIQKGSRMRRWSSRERDSVTQGILDSVVPGAKRALQAQIEIVDQGKGRNETEVALATFNAMKLELDADFEREKAQLHGQMTNKQRKMRRRFERETEQMRTAAARERQIEQDAQFAAELVETEAIEEENSRVREQLQQQIVKKQEESQRTKLKLEKDNAEWEAQQSFNKAYQCTHAWPEMWDTCGQCKNKLHKERNYYFREYCSSLPERLRIDCFRLLSV